MQEARNINIRKWVRTPEATAIAVAHRFLVLELRRLDRPCGGGRILHIDIENWMLLSVSLKVTIGAITLSSTQARLRPKRSSKQHVLRALLRAHLSPASELFTLTPSLNRHPQLSDSVRDCNEWC